MLPPSASLSSHSRPVQGSRSQKHAGAALLRAAAVHGSARELSTVTAPDPNPFVDVVVFQGGATLFNRQLASTIHCVNDEIIKCLKRRERRRCDRHAPPRLA